MCSNLNELNEFFPKLSYCYYSLNYLLLQTECGCRRITRTAVCHTHTHIIRHTVQIKNFLYFAKYWSIKFSHYSYQYCYYCVVVVVVVVVGVVVAAAAVAEVVVVVVVVVLTYDAPSVETFQSYTRTEI